MIDLSSWKAAARRLRQEVQALILAAKDPRVPWVARALAVVIIAYALSPIDLIPDFVPILGHLDDLILIPLGVALVIRLIPPAVLAECRERARAADAGAARSGRIAALCIALLWALLLGFTIRWIAGTMEWF